MEESILVFTSKDDPSVVSVIDILEKRRESVVRINTDEAPSIQNISFKMDNGKISLYVDGILIGKIKSCWYRGARGVRYEPDLDDGYNRFIQEETKSGLWALCTSLDTFWVNSPLIGSRLLESNKILQMKAAAEVGLMVPETIVTSNPETLVRFCAEVGGVLAVKLLSGYIFVREGSDEMLSVYTRRVTESDITNNAQGISLAPVFAQRYIPKKFELRVTVVGEKIFACAIHSQKSERTKDDWRHYDFPNVPHEEFELPTEISERLLKFMKCFGLQFGAIDMIVTPEDEYVFLEVNPQGQWGWIEDITGMPISKAIAELLANPPKQN